MTMEHELGAEHDQLESSIAEHALGTLEPDLRARVDAHLARCAACRTTFDELAATSAALELACADAMQVQPHVDATQQLVAAAARTQQQAAPTRTERHPRRARRRWSLPSLVAAAGACSTILVLGVLLADSRQHADSLERRLADARGDQVAVLRGASIDDLDLSGPFGDARAQVVLQRDAGLVAFRDVPAPPAQMVWQVWLVGEDGRLRSLGTIDGARRSAFLAIEDIDAEEIERIIVTVEPAGGSVAPSATDEPVAEGTV